MVCSQDPENISITKDDDALQQVTKYKCLGSIFTEYGKNKEDVIQRVKEATIMFNNKKATILFE